MVSKDSQKDDSNRLIDLLVDCPSLEFLTLENCLPVTLSESSGEQTIHLPRLSRLSLAGSSSRVTNLLKMLKLSSSTTLRLNCMSENTATHNDYHILPFISAHFNDPTPVKFRCFRIYLRDVDRLIEMVASTSLPISPIPDTAVIQADSDTELSLSFHHAAELDNRADILRRACTVLSLSNVEFLSVDSLTPNQFINWNEIFRHCTEVTTVQVYGCGTMGLLQGLTQPKLANTTFRGKGAKRKHGDNDRGAGAQGPDDDDNDGPAPVYMPMFPKLTSLSLDSLDFTDALPGSGDLSDLILSAVQWRKANKTPLTILCIDNCTIMEEQANTLEKVVPDFWWDHDEGISDDEEGDGEDYDDYFDEFGDWDDDIGPPVVG